MSRTGLTFVIAVAAVIALSGCARKLAPGVLEGGAHVPPPPSEQHRVTSRIPASAAPQAEAPAPGRLKAPAGH